MLNFSKSKNDSDLQNRTTVQQKVLCDWLRQIQSQNVQLARRLTVLQKSIDLLLSESTSINPENFEEIDSSESGSVS